MSFETRNDVTEDEYIEMIRLKTSVLLACALKIGALLADAPQADADRLYRFGEQVGLAFQIVDDLLDMESTPEELGKSVGKDAAAQKLTFPLIFGAETSRIMARDAAGAARKALDDFDDRADPLRALARYIVERRK